MPIEPDLTALILESCGAAMSAARMLAVNPGDPAHLTAALGPVLRWMREWTSMADLAVRIQVAEHLTQTLPPWNDPGSDYSPSRFVEDAETLRAVFEPLAEDAGWAGVGVLPPDRERVVACLRNLISAAAEPCRDWRPDGLAELTAEALRYPRVGTLEGGPLTEADYERALRLLYGFGPGWTLARVAPGRGEVGGGGIGGTAGPHVFTGTAGAAMPGGAGGGGGRCGRSNDGAGSAFGPDGSPVASGGAR